MGVFNTWVGEWLLLLSAFIRRRRTAYFTCALTPTVAALRSNAPQQCQPLRELEALCEEVERECLYDTQEEGLI
jgi:hypothetical protein